MKTEVYRKSVEKPVSTIKRSKQYESGNFDDVNSESCPRFMTAKEKYQILLEASGLVEDERGRFLRERGVHSEHLVIWDQELRAIMANKPDPKDQELRELKKKNKELEKELQRKERALAEAAALLVLKKNSTPLRGITRATDSW